jgi:2-phospho-L-lactate guanylyltransferase (CobY/MobA/RfbA family)
VVVITSDPEAQQIARELNAIALTDDQNAGQTAAVEQGMRFLKAQGVKIMLTLPADLPLLAADDVESFCALINSENEVVLAPAANDGGTNAIACDINCAMCFHFGDDSFQKHKKSILAVDAKPIISTANGFCLDVDRPEDLFEFLKSPSTTYSYELLSSLINPPVIRLHQTDRVST